MGICNLPLAFGFGLKYRYYEYDPGPLLKKIDTNKGIRIKQNHRLQIQN